MQLRFDLLDAVAMYTWAVVVGGGIRLTYVLHRAPPLRLERLEFVFSGRVHMRTYFVDSVLG